MMPLWAMPPRELAATVKARDRQEAVAATGAGKTFVSSCFAVASSALVVSSSARNPVTCAHPQHHDSETLKAMPAAPVPVLLYVSLACNKLWA